MTADNISLFLFEIVEAIWVDYIMCDWILIFPIWKGEGESEIESSDPFL